MFYDANRPSGNASGIPQENPLTQANGGNNPLPEGSATPGVNAPPETVAEANAEVAAAYPLTAEEIASLKDCTCTGTAEAHRKVKTGTTTQKVDTFTFVCPTSSI